MTFKEDELRFVNVLSWNFKNDSITEYCPDCDTEVELRTAFSDYGEEFVRYERARQNPF